MYGVKVLNVSGKEVAQVKSGEFGLFLFSF